MHLSLFPTPPLSPTDCVLWTANRAFVSTKDLLLSPRHEQAKRIQERARMKARSYPLKADHTILPVQRDNPWVA